MTALRLAAALLIVMPQAVVAQTHLIIIGGLGGEAQYRRAFHAWAKELKGTAIERLGVAAGHVTYLAEKPERDPGTIDGVSTKENIERLLGAVAGEAAPTAQLVLILIGHGSERNGEARFNLPGPDLTARELDVLLDALPMSRIIVVNTASASGGFIPVLSGDGRTIITATKSGMERNRTLFGEYIVAAFADADGDKDGRISVLEAFNYASHEVRQRFESEHRLLTEHAQLDDNGDGEGSATPSIDGPDGMLAGVTYLDDLLPGLAAAGDSVLLALLERKAELGRAIAALRQRKNAMVESEYLEQLEDLLVELAETAQAIRDREGRW